MLRGLEAELHNESCDDLPFSSRFVLLDFQRVFYPWVSASERPLPDGEHIAEVGGEKVRELWADGRLIERRFRRLDGQPPGDLVVRCTWPGAGFDYGGETSDGARSSSGAEPGGPADSLWCAHSRAVLDNRWFGYGLVVDTLQETLMEPLSQGEGP